MGIEKHDDDPTSAQAVVVLADLMERLTRALLPAPESPPAPAGTTPPPPGALPAGPPVVAVRRTTSVLADLAFLDD